MTEPIFVRRCTPESLEWQAVHKLLYAGLQQDVPVDKRRLVDCFVGLRGEDALGRVALYHNPGVRNEGAPVAFLGNFESVDDSELSNALLDAATSAASKLRTNRIVGPVNGSTWDSYRFIVERGAEPRFTSEMAHPDYYPALWEAAGFSLAERYVSNIAAIRLAPVDESIFTKNELRARALDVANLETELARVYPVCMSAFAGSPFFSLTTISEFTERLLPLRPILNGELTKLVEDAAGNPVAFVLSFPDQLDPERKRLVIKTVAKSPELRVPGLVSGLAQAILNTAHEAGYREVIHAFMHVGNRSMERSEDFNSSTFRRYGLFAKNL